MRSLRGRLTIWLTAVLAVALVVAGVLAEREVDRSQREALDERLVRTAELSQATARAAVQEELPSADDRLDAVLGASRTSLRLRVGPATLLETGSPVPRAPRRLATGLSTFSARGQRFRAYVTELRDPGLGGLARLEVVTEAGFLEERQDALRRRLVLFGLLALALGALGVFLASGVILRPLRRLRSATAAIAGDRDLERRVPADGPAELRALASSFNAMLERLSASATDRERALAATRRFTADAGHELRTPLTSIQATLSSLARHPELDAERRTRMAREALAQQERLVALLAGLQALARGDASPDTAEVDLAEVADAAAGAARDRHPDVRLTADVPDAAVPVEAWAPGLRSALDNLLENAARHGRPGGEIAIAVAGGPAPEVVVEDDGPGIAEADRERIFEPFTRLEGAGEGGSGLGLALVAQQARHHGAAIEVGRSERLGGARFALRFPTRAGAAAPAPTPSAAGRGAPARR